MRISFADHSILFCSKNHFKTQSSFFHMELISNSSSSLPLLSPCGVESLPPLHTQILKNTENSLLHRFPSQFFIHLSARVFSLQLASSSLTVDFGWERLRSDG